MNNPDFLVNLGITTENQDNVLKLKFNKKGSYTFDSLEILAVSMKEYEEKINKLNMDVMQNIRYGDNYISGTVNLNRNAILQITTSYSNGWKAYIDGKKAEVFKVNEAFVGINIEAGDHTVEFKYETPYLRLGAITSTIGILAYIIIIIIDKKRKK